MASTKSKGKAGGKRRSLAPSAPELKVTYKAAGRDTMAAIEDELLTPSHGVAETPLIEITETPAGRETMAAIEQELAGEMRPKQNTLPYGDRIPNAPGARRPSKAPAARSAQKAEPAASAAGAVAAEQSLPGAGPATDVQIFELLTFIVRGSGIGELTTDALRRRFVEQHLLRRIPGQSLSAVERIEVTPWTAKGTMILRVWCRA